MRKPSVVLFVWQAVLSLIAIPFALVLILLAFMAGGPRPARQMYHTFF